MVDHAAQGRKSAQTDPDVALMLQVKEDDAHAFRELVIQYEPRLRRILKHIVGSDSSAEDLVQDVFMRVWRARKRYEPAAKFSTWLFHIAHNVASNALRDRRRRREYQTSENQNDSGSFGLNEMAMDSTGVIPVRRLDKVERAEMVRYAIEALNERQRMALMLSRFEGLSYQEIADTMELTVQAVKSLLSRARVNLKTLLQPYLADGMLPGAPQQPGDPSGGVESTDQEEQK